MYSFLIYILRAEGISLYYAHQERCTTIQLRHRIKAGFAVVDFLVLLILLLILPIKLPMLQLFDIVNQPSVLYRIGLLTMYMVIAMLCVWLLGKIRNIYIFSAISLLFEVLLIYNMIK